MFTAHNRQKRKYKYLYCDRCYRHGHIAYTRERYGEEYLMYEFRVGRCAREQLKTEENEGYLNSSRSHPAETTVPFIIIQKKGQ